MRTVYKILWFTALTFFMASCAFHSGNITTAPQGADFTYMEQAVGQAKTFKVFGFGGLRRDALVFEARQDLMRNRPLKEGEAYANYVVDIKTSFILVYSATKVSVTADVIEYEGELKERYSENYPLVFSIGDVHEESSTIVQNIDTTSSLNAVLYRKGDIVYNKRGRSFLVKGQTDEGLFVTGLEVGNDQLEILAWENVHFHIQQLESKLDRISARESKRESQATDLLQVFDTVIDKRNQQLIIVEMGDEVSVLELLRNNGSKRMVLKPVKKSKLEVFSTKTQDYKGFKIGQEVLYRNETYYVAAFGEDHVLLVNGESAYTKAEYQKIK